MSTVTLRLWPPHPLRHVKLLQSTPSVTLRALPPPIPSRDGFIWTLPYLKQHISPCNAPKIHSKETNVALHCPYKPRCHFLKRDMYGCGQHLERDGHAQFFSDLDPLRRHARVTPFFFEIYPPPRVTRDGIYERPLTKRHKDSSPRSFAGNGWHFGVRAQA